MDGTKVGEAKGPNSALDAHFNGEADHSAGYNPGMPRAASWALLVAGLLTLSAAAQRTGGFHGPTGSPVTGPAFAQRSSFSSAFYGGSHHGGFYPYFLPYFLPDDRTYFQEEPRPEPLQRVLYSPEPERTSTAAELIEIPAAPSAKPAGPQPPAVFVLTSGERLEARRFLLTSTSLSVSINRSQRLVPLVIPIQALDLDATVAANRERGIQLQIPADRNEISLSF